MQAEQIASMETAIDGALQKQQELFDKKLAAVIGKLNSLKVKDNISQIQTFQEIELKPEIQCNDMVKSVPEFDGKQENYVSWRQAATAAHGKKDSQRGFNKKLHAGRKTRRQRL